MSDATTQQSSVTAWHQTHYISDPVSATECSGADHVTAGIAARHAIVDNAHTWQGS